MANSNTISILVTARDHASRVVRGVAKNVEASGDRAGRADAAFAAFRSTLGTGMMIAGAAAATGLGAAIKATGDYESSLSQLKQASGANAEQMSAMSRLTRQLGQDNDLAGVTAADAARTMVELSKAGLSVNDTMAASKGVMSLARAGNIQFADAAVIAASALNAFGLEGKDANKVADTLAAGANASQAELSDLALGMQQSATVAKQFGLSLNENVTALALFANNGIKGSDAGTSLKTMLIALAKPSDVAAAKMKEMGFNAYDADGKFVGLREMSIRLNKSLQGLTKEQQQNALATIFGTDAFRAAAVLADNAGKSYDKMSKSVDKNGAAQKAAAAQMGPFKKATEGFNNAMSELGLSIGERVIPYVTGATNAAADFVRSVNSGLPGAISTFQSLLPIITSLSAGVAALVVVQNTATVSTRGLTIAQGALNAVMRLNPLSLVAGAAVGLVTAYMQVVTQANSAQSASQRLKMAHEGLRQSTDALRLSQEALKGAFLNQEGASLAVERAQKQYNESVRQYGPKSLEAREAAHNLKLAQDRLRQANEEVRKKTREVIQAEIERKKKAAEVVAANNRVATSARNAAGGYAAWAQAIRDARKEDAKGPIRTAPGAGKAEVNATLRAPWERKRAIGTNYDPGGTALVGEHGPELVNLPRGSQVIPHYRTRSILQGAGDTYITISGNITIQTPEAANAFWDRIDKTQRLAKVGMA